MAEQTIYANVIPTGTEVTGERQPKSHCCQDSISDKVMRQKLSRSLETQKNLTQTLQEANQRVTCLRGAISASDQTPECPPGWTLINQKCYFLSSDKKTREDSERSCVGNGAVLATVRSKDSKLKCHMQSQNAEFWVGLQKGVTWTGDVAMTQWIWSDNTTESSLANNPSTQCAKMGQTISLSPCSDLLPWTCERKPNKSNLLDKANAC
ncbi:C-type lectin domain family 12 member B-like [Rana temporaria]|uniref:C-type lectin domain family 12 member B-like n=1 Tax=Rana temporaria TaxID=8407 RepID=UPI001AAE071F|nr:C-type lectin domain family 12 member B-like [Rana temporaria]